MNEKWNLDRKPTRAERGIGIAGAFLLCAAGVTGFWLSAVVKKSLPASLVTGAFTGISMLFLFRFIFTGGEKLQRQGIIATAVVFTVVGLAMLIGSFFAGLTQERLFLLSLGTSGVGGGLLNFSKAKKISNQSTTAQHASRVADR